MKRFLMGVLVFWLILIIFPNMGIRDFQVNEENARNENRKINEFPIATIGTKDFYTEFEKWYNDRLKHKGWIVENWRKKNYEIFGTISNDNIIIAEDGYYFSKRPYTTNVKELDVKIQKILKIQEICQKNGIEFMLIIPPTKEYIERNYIPKILRNRVISPEDIYSKVEKSLFCNGINYINIRNVFENKPKDIKDELFFKDDHHWSYTGASIAADCILMELYNKKLINEYEGLKLDGRYVKAYKECSGANQMGFNRNWECNAPWSTTYGDNLYFLDDGKENKVVEPLSNNTMWGRMVLGEAVVINKDIKDRSTILVLSDSYSSYMAPYLSQFVNKYVQKSYNRCEGDEKSINMNNMINKYKPSVVILEIWEPNFYHNESSFLFGKILIDR